MMNTEIKLSDESYEKIFSVDEASKNNKESHFNRHLCRVGRLPGEYNLRIHMKGKKHLKNLQKVPDAETFRKPFSATENSQRKFAFEFCT